MRRHCVLPQVPDIVRPMRPEHPGLCPMCPVRPGVRRNVLYLLTQCRALPTSRLPQIVPLVPLSS